MKFTKRSVVTVFTSVFILCFLAVGVSSNTVAGETAVVPIAAPVAVVATNCGGSNDSALVVARWTPVRNVFTKAKIRRAARCSGRSSCSAPQTVAVEVRPVRVISVAPIRLFRSCKTGVCK